MALFTNYVDILAGTTLEPDQVLAWDYLCASGEDGNNCIFVVDNEGARVDFLGVGAALDYIREQGGMVVFMDNGGNGFYTIEEIL